jgi:pimeloyl-ACP methyl ester carboxylesterase
MVSIVARAQSIEGSWTGALQLPGSKLPLIFHIAKGSEAYTATLDSPNQGARGIPAHTVSYKHPTLTLTLQSLGAVFEGAVTSDTLIEGIFTQMGQKFPLNLTKQSVHEKAAKIKRPQTPLPPFPYRSEEVAIKNSEAGVELSGTLTIPEGRGPFPAAILISGSGPQNRDEELFDHKPFLVIADYLTRNGMAILRYDDRGVAKSTGDFSRATSADFAKDAGAVYSWLTARPDIDKNKTGLIGHSEGGMIAPMVAASNQNVSFLILLAAPGVPIDSLLTLQNRAISKAMGMPANEIEDNIQTNRKIFSLAQKAPADLKQQLTALLNEEFSKLIAKGAITQEQANQSVYAQVEQFTSPWMRYFINYDPTDNLQKIKVPVLALNGDKDLQVTSKENLSGIRSAFQRSGNQKLTVKELKDHNHLFQTTTLGSPTEYGQLEETFSEVALREILSWLDSMKIISYAQDSK